MRVRLASELDLSWPHADPLQLSYILMPAASAVDLLTLSNRNGVHINGWTTKLYINAKHITVLESLSFTRGRA